ncbi:CYTH and CHAD domain-containing protein [Bosea sp. NPDC055353]
MDRSALSITEQIRDGPGPTALMLSLSEGNQRRVLKLLRCAGGKDLGRAKAFKSVYYDTRRETLARAGYRLSVQAQGLKRTQHIEVTDTALFLSATACWAHEIGDVAPSRASVRATPLDDILDDKALARLKPLFDLDIRRRSLVLDRDGASIIACFDTGAITAGAAVERICELRLKLIAGSPVALLNVAREFGVHLPVTFGLRSYGERGFGLLHALAGPGNGGVAGDVRGEMTAGEGSDSVCQSCVAALFDALTLLTFGRGRDVLHGVRIGLRRLRATLWFLKPLLGPGIGPISNRLRAFAQFLGKARELDVFCDRVLAPLRLRNPDAPGMEALLQAFEHRRRAAHDEVLAFAQSPAMLEFGFALLEGLAALSGPQRSLLKNPRQRDRPIKEFVQARLDRRLRTFLKASRNLESCSPDGQHDIRIVAKKLRYAIESFHSVIGTKTSRKLISKLTMLQDVLGELNDARSSQTIALSYAREWGRDDHGEALLFAAGLAAGACNPDPARALAKAAATRGELAALAR